MHHKILQNCSAMHTIKTRFYKRLLEHEMMHNERGYEVPTGTGIRGGQVKR